MSWRTLACVLAAVSIVQTYRACNAPAAPAADDRRAHAEACAGRPAVTYYAHDGEHPRSDEPAAAPADDDGASGPMIAGIKVPAWALWLAPHPGEDMLAYRDRMMPLARAALAPQRARVARSRDDFAAAVHLAPSQSAALDTAASRAASAIEERVLGAALGGDFDPSTFKPMTGVAVARDVLDTIDRENQKFLATLSDDQKATLAQHPFDFGDYLLFSTKWEQALGVTD